MHAELEGFDSRQSMARDANNTSAMQCRMQAAARWSVPSMCSVHSPWHCSC